MEVQFGGKKAKGTDFFGKLLLWKFEFWFLRAILKIIVEAAFKTYFNKLL